MYVDPSASLRAHERASSGTSAVGCLARPATQFTLECPINGSSAALGGSNSNGRIATIGSQSVNQLRSRQSAIL